MIYQGRREKRSPINPRNSSEFGIQLLDDLTERSLKRRGSNPVMQTTREDNVQNKTKTGQSSLYPSNRAAEGLM